MRILYHGLGLGLGCTMLFSNLALAAGSAAKEETAMAGKLAQEDNLERFLGEAKFGMRQIFIGERFPNVVVATDGTVLATWGSKSVKARRSHDGGETWGPEIPVADPGFHGGGLLVDESTGDILAFAQDKHPPAKKLLYRSKDQGKTWEREDLVIEKDVRGNVPEMHMAEHGITLCHGQHPGRLLRPARVYGKSDGYNTAIYSDNAGKTWRTSGPFPLMGTGEGAVAELSNGHLYYTSRKHWFKDAAQSRAERSFAWSTDAGETWRDVEYDSELPDGPRYRGVEGRGASHQGHFGMMCGLARLPVENRDILLYSNADTLGHERVRMTVWVTLDGGKTWPVKRLIYEGPSAYSSLAAGRPGTPSEGWIYVLFEGGEKEKYEGGYLARFNLGWVLQGEKTGDGEPGVSAVRCGHDG